MQSKVTEEGNKEKALFDKYMCWCKSGSSDLSSSIAAAEAKISSLPSEIEASEATLTQAKATLAKATEDRAAAKEAMAAATSIREKEAATYAAFKADKDANMDAIAAAVAALEKGMAGAFLQTDAAQVLKRLTNNGDMPEDSRQAVLAFLEGGSSSQGNPFSQGYAPSSGQITGLLKELSDDMDRDLAATTKEEEAAIATYEQLMAAKTKEVNACTAQIEAKTNQIGELGIEIVELKEDLSDTEAAYMEDKQFLADLEKNCATKTAEWEVVVKTRADELAALADTIKILNDDDALELFKKTLPTPSASFMQLSTSIAQLRRNALAVVRGARAQRANSRHRAQFDLLELALTGKKVSFEKVLKMIDEMVAMLKEEQLDDDHKKEYCLTQFDLTDDKKKSLERTMSLETAAIEKAKEAIATLTEEIAALEAGIKALDKAVAEATEQRKEENEDYTELIASDTAAKELLGLARNRLNKFYNPKLYKPAPKRVLDAEESIVVSMGNTLAPTQPPGGIAGTGVTVLAQIQAHTHRSKGSVAPPPPPEAVAAYTKKSEENTGVIGMIDLLIGDLDKEMTESTTGEQEAQKDYETMMADSAAKRTEDSATLSSKMSTKADTEAALQEAETAHTAAAKEHMATLEYDASLHAECDWLLKYFETRKEARAGEVDSLKRAKDVLSGADYSLVQTARGAQKSLRGRSA
jgi:phage shock protein A